MITGDNITDEQIQAMRADYNPGSVSDELCALALDGTPGATARFERVIGRSEARARCAEILNARTVTP